MTSSDSGAISSDSGTMIELHGLERRSVADQRRAGGRDQRAEMSEASSERDGLRAFVPVPGRETNGWMLSHVCILPSRRNDERSRPKPKNLHC